MSATVIFGENVKLLNCFFVYVWYLLVRFQLPSWWRISRPRTLTTSGALRYTYLYTAQENVLQLTRSSALGFSLWSLSSYPVFVISSSSSLETTLRSVVYASFLLWDGSGVVLILLFPIFFSLMTEKLRDFLMTNWSDIRFDILGKVHLLSSRELYSGMIVSLAAVANIKFCSLYFCPFQVTWKSSCKESRICV